jgi:hypothetical protein
MARYKTKAEQNFEVRFRQALMWRDWHLVEKALTQYGYYLELVDPEAGEGDAMEMCWELVPVQPDYSRLPEWYEPEFKRLENDIKIAEWREELAGDDYWSKQNLYKKYGVL